MASRRTSSRANSESLFQQRRAHVAAALLLCHGRTSVKAVHELRKAGNRLSAIVEKDLADHPASKVLRKRGVRLLLQLKKIRKLAGEVRDLDVHLGLVTSLLRGRTGDEHLELTGLSARLKEEREAAANNLREALPNRETKLEKALDAWVKALATLPPAAYPVLPVAEHWWKAAVRRHTPVTEENLHDLRKDSKRARYLAETGPAPAQKLASQLHSFSTVVGTWHDWLTLHGRAKATLPKGAPVRQLLRGRAKSELVKALAAAEGLAEQSTTR